MCDSNEIVLENPNQETTNHREDQRENVLIPDRSRMLEALNVVEKDSVAIAESYHSLFTSLRMALSEITGSSIEHMDCFNDAAGHLQESALDAATKGNHFINSCLRLNQEIKGVENLAIQLKILRRNVDALETAANRFLRFP